MTLPSRLFVPAASAALLALFVAAPPASAATSSVATLGELQAALADCATAPNTITLTADISSPGTALATGCDTTLQLGSHALTVRNIEIGGGTTLTVGGSSGTLTADASGSSFTPGVRTTGATFTVTGANVIARGGINASAIGGGLSDSAGTLNVSGGMVSAYAYSTAYGTAIGGGYLSGDGGAVNVSGGSVYAENASIYGVTIGGGGAGSGDGGSGGVVNVTGGELTVAATGTYGTAIGGGMAGFNPSDRGGSGATVTVGAAGTLTASAPNNAIGSGFADSLSENDGDFGRIQVDGTLYLPSGKLSVTDSATPGSEVTVGATGKILGSTATPATGASIVGAGAIANGGVIALNPPTSMVAGNNRLITFSTADPSVRVFAPSMNAGYRTLPAPPAGTAWNTASNGSGAWFTGASSTAGSGTTALYVVAPATLDVSTDPTALTATAGDPYDFPVVALGTDGLPIGPQPTIDYTSSDCTITSGDVLTAAGPCTITATTTVQGVTVSKNFAIDVVAGPASALTIVSSATTVKQGGSLTFAVTGEDAYGNPVDTSAATLTSSVDTDLVSGMTVSFPHASPHTITATLGAASASVTVQVSPAAVPQPDPEDDDELPTTGGESPTVVWTVGALLLTAGAGVILSRRRILR